MVRMKWLVSFAAVMLVGGPVFGAAAIKSGTTGTPKILSIDVIRFAPEGVLLIGDGKGAQILAVDTKDTAPKPALKNAIDKFDDKLAAKLGATGKQIVITDLAVNPASKLTYVAIRRQSDGKPIILTVDGEGKIGEFALENVTYARVQLPAGDKAPITKLTDLAWAGSRILAAGQANEEFACKIFSIPAPVEHDAKGNIYSTETYHVSHGRWETKAPMSTLMPYEEAGKMYVVGSFACTPVVKYPIDDLQPGAKVKGISVIELGAGNRPLRMFSYDKNGQSYVLMNTFRFHHKQKAFGPSPYWTVRMERNLLAEKEKVDTKAVRRLDSKYNPATETMKMIEEFHGVVNMDKLDNERALVLRQDDKGDYTLSPIALP